MKNKNSEVGHLHVDIPRRFIDYLENDVSIRGYGTKTTRLMEILSAVYEPYRAEIDRVRLGGTQVDPSIVATDSDVERRR